MNPKRTTLWLVVAMVGLNCLLFVPSFVCRGAPADFFPFTPREHPHGAYGFDLRSAVEYVKALLLRRENPDVFRVSFEFVLLSLALLISARSRFARLTRALLAVGYTTALVLLAYHFAYGHFYRTQPALWEDITLVTSLLRYVASELGKGVLVMLLAFVAAAVASVLFVTFRVFRAVQETGGKRAFGALIALALCSAGSLAWFGSERLDPEFVLSTKPLQWNYRLSMARRDKVLALRGALPDRRYEPMMRARLDRKPPVYLLMIEAYGQRLASDPQLEPVFRALTGRIMERLGSKGFHARTAYSRAPIYGGRSWLSIGSVQTGVRIEHPSIYDEMAKVGPRIPTLTRFFTLNGYRTLALQSGNTVKNDPKLVDAFARDVVVEGPDLPYRGPRMGYGGIPDQYALSWFRENVLTKETGPTFVFYMSVSTHFSWPSIPFAADWKQLDGPDPQVAPWDPIPELAAMPEGYPARYADTVVYEWRALADFIESEASKDAIFFVVGDHQPLLERTMDDVDELARLQTLNTPVHVLSRDTAFVERFDKWGFAPGLFAEAGTGGLMHEGLFSLFVSELVAHLGPPGETRFTRYEPEGSSLTAFSPE